MNHDLPDNIGINF